MSRTRFLAGAFAALLLASAARATTFQMVSDAALVDQAAVIAEVSVASVDPAPQGPPATDYLVEVQRLLKGSLSGTTILVRVPGGVGADGVGLRIWGAPEFAEQERALVFLSPRADGTYAVLHLMLGAFHDVAGVAERFLGDAQELTAQGLRPGQETAVRDFERFVGWAGDRAAGVLRPADYLRPESVRDRQAVVDRFTLLRASSDGANIRWFVFDQGGHVDWRVGQGGQPGLSEADTIAAFQAGLQAWNDDAGSNVDYRYVGTTTSTQGLQHNDGVNAILFGDPNHEVSQVFDCSTGGVIAQGGPWFFSTTTPRNGKPYHEAAEGDIVVNDGTQCLFQNNPRVAQEVFGHELGHTLGLGHSCGDSSSPFCLGAANRILNDALMRASIHNDGRGARLNADDMAGIAALYGSGTTSGRVPASPARLVARATGTTTVALKWRDRANNETAFVVEGKTGSGPFAILDSLPANTTTATVADLAPGTLYWFRVKATNAKGSSGYSNVVKVVTLR